MISLFSLLFLSCAKVPLDHTTAQSLFKNENCVTELQDHMRKSGCKHLRYTSTSDVDIMFRCIKPDNERGEFWDNFIFRASPAALTYNDEESRKLIDAHTICNDGHMRIEAYPPSFKK